MNAIGNVTLSDLQTFGIGLGWSLAASTLAWGLLRALMVSRRWLRRQVRGGIHDRHGSLGQYMDLVRTGVQFVIDVFAWALGILLADAWISFVMRQFEATRPWGERSTRWMLDLLTQFAHGIAGAMPGLIAAMLIFAIARMVSHANTLFLNRVERGEIEVSWLDVDTVTPSRRISNVAIWLFALAMAYPYLPGAGSDAFKGVSVLLGLMLSLGGSGVVGQVMAGMSLMYSRSLRVGEYVRIGDTEGATWHPDHSVTTPPGFAAAYKAYQEAGVTNPRQEISLAEVHDCFSITELVTMEDLFLSEEGQSWRDYLDGFYDSDGGLPCQIDGGLKCFGHPIGASGLRMVYEMYLQLQERAGPRQVSNPTLGLTHNLGGAPHQNVCSVAIIGR